MKCPKCHSENPDTSRFCGNCASFLSGEGNGSVTITKTLETTAKVLAKGSLIAGKYRILEEIGKGGMGIVYKAEDTKLKRIVALKFLPSQLTLDQDARERFIHEAQAASALDHPNICNIHEIEDTEAGQMYIAMAYYEGESLREKIKRGQLEKEEALDLASQLAQGMAKAHQKGIIHRDLKPANIVVTDDGVAKIVDFGLAKLAGQMRLTRDGATMGTVAYMSPEQAQGQSVDHRTDIWSLGVVLYEMLTGQMPFKGEYEQSIIHSILNRAPEPITKIRKGLPVAIERVIGKALEKNPADRYQSMDEFIGDIKAIAEGLRPIRAKASLLRGRILGVKRIYAYAGLASLIAIIAVAMVFLFPRRGQAYDSIAVLPFQNISGDPEQESFCDGVQQELITQLSRIKAIKKVIAKSSTMGYKDTKKKSSEIAGELKVAALVAGGANHSGNKVRISYEIIDGQNDKLIGGDSFDGEYQDILTLQSEAALAIAKQIQATLTPEETKALARSRPVNPEAYEAYQNGMYIIGSGRVAAGDRSDLDTSIRYFERALKIDPQFAPAYAGLAVVYDFYTFITPVEEGWSKAKDAALKAISLDDSVADAYYVLADMKTSYEYDWEGGEKAWKRALEVNPNHALVHAIYGGVLAGQGRNQEAIAHAERARELDPRTLLTIFYVDNIYQKTRQYDQGIALIKESLALFPNNAQLYMRLTVHCALNGMVKEAIAAGEKADELGGAGITGVALARAYTVAGNPSKARDTLNAFVKKAKEMYAAGAWATALRRLAMAYAELGEKDKAFECLDLWYQRRHPNINALKVEPFLDNLHSDPRFTTLLKKVGLEK